MSVQYDEYLENHKSNVKKAFAWLDKNLPDIIHSVRDDLEWQICFGHDASKYKKDEYEAYDAYFYGGNRSYQVMYNFKNAFNTHIHRNPHHWQHWVLIHDDPDEPETILDMPDNYIIEMICDWWSFSWAKGDLNEIFAWYEEHKNYIKLSESTRHNIEFILNKMKEKLKEV